LIIVLRRVAPYSSVPGIRLSRLWKNSRNVENDVKSANSKKGDLRSTPRRGVTKIGIAGNDRSMTPSKKAMYRLSMPEGADFAIMAPDWTKTAPRVTPSHPIQTAIRTGFFEM